MTRDPGVNCECPSPRRAPKFQGVRPKVLAAIMSGYCNTSQDVAEETGLSAARCSSCINKLIGDGIIRWTDRVIRVRNYKLRIFEVVA